MRFLVAALALAACAPMQVDPALRATVPAGVSTIAVEVPVDVTDPFATISRELALAGYAIESSDRDSGSILTTGREEGRGAWRLALSVAPEVLIFVDARLSSLGSAGVMASNNWRRTTMGESGDVWFAKGVDFATGLGWPVAYR